MAENVYNYEQQQFNNDPPSGNNTPMGDTTTVDSQTENTTAPNSTSQTHMSEEQALEQIPKTISYVDVAAAQKDRQETQASLPSSTNIHQADGSVKAPIENIVRAPIERHRIYSDTPYQILATSDNKTAQMFM